MPPLSEPLIRSLVIAFSVSLVGSLLLTLVGGWLGRRLGVVAQPGGRRQHGGLVSRLGGLGLFLPFMASIAVLQFLPQTWVPTRPGCGSTCRWCCGRLSSLLRLG